MVEQGFDIGDWLSGLGLSRYEAAFRDNDIDPPLLPSLTSDDLKDMGVASVGHRRRLLEAIAALRPAGGPAPSGTTAPAPDAAMAEAEAPPAHSHAERRQLTVMFVDLVGSTALSGQLDPEVMGELIRDYQNKVAGEIARYEGYVAKYMGDGVLAYFGWPKAHEDEAERAARAGLAIAKAVAGLATPTGAPLAVRVGIATGLVVVGDRIGSGGASEEAVVGETPNLAARLQELAEPGGIVVAEGTRRLLGGLFALHDLGPVRLKGFAEPVRAWRIAGEGAAEGRFEALHAAGLAPLVGREHELALLLERWERARDREGQVVLLAGEAGIGKSRLVRALRERLQGEPHTPLSHFCSPYHTHTALHPVIGLLERAAGLRREDPPERRLDRLEAMLALATEAVGEAVPVLADLLAIPVPTGRYPPLALSPQQKKERTFRALLDQLAGLVAHRPVLAVYEDAHWADPTTLEFLGRVVEQAQRLPVLAVVTFRPEFVPPWAGHGHVTALSLSRLGRRQGGAMIARVASGKALPAEVADQILARTDGVPLFVEELTKAVLESGLLADRGDRYEISGPLPPLAIPSTLQDSLMARLDRLAPVKEVAQVAAVIGREFPFELLAAVTAMEGPELRQALGRLAEADLVFPRGALPEATYVFKHALVQDAAYASLLKSRRQLLHARIAAVLEERFPGTAEAEPELLARHCSSAGLAGKATKAWARAGRMALARSATAEAIAHFRAALQDLAATPEGPARDREELDIQRALGSAMTAAHGFAAPETGRVYEQALALAERLGEVPELFPVLYGLCLFHLYRAEPAAARDAAERLLGLAAQSGDRGHLFFAHRAAGVSAYPAGDFVAAQRHLEQALLLYDPVEHRAPAFVYAFDPQVVCLDYLARTLLPMGRVADALRRSEQALAEARRLGQRNSLCLPLFFGATLRQLLGDREAVLAHVDELDAIAEEERFPIWAAGARVLRGWAAADRAGIEEGIRSWQATGAGFMVPYFQALAAEVEADAGRIEESAALLREAVRRAEATGETWCLAELHRRLGESAWRLGEQGQAASCFERALELAGRQGAWLWQLRAAIAMARLGPGAGRLGEALASARARLDAESGLAELAEADRLLGSRSEGRRPDDQITLRSTSGRPARMRSKPKGERSSVR